jgi:hypothetical protein
VIQLNKSLNAWKTPDFNDVLKEEIEHLDIVALPLQQALSHSSYAIDGKFNVMIINAYEEDGVIKAKTGIFYTGIIPGCACEDDPTPVSEYSEYCELRFNISKNTAETTISLVS